MEDPVRTWAPSVIENIDQMQLDLYLEFSTSACVPGACCNIEEALDILYESNGDINLATQRLLTSKQDSQRDQTVWTSTEVQTFEALIGIYGKNFHEISKAMQSIVSYSTKSVKDCVRFYYLWKKSSFRTRPECLVLKLSTSSSLSPRSSEISLPATDETKGSPSSDEVFPCKICGRIFEKIKSRSAHMKRHKNERQPQIITAKIDRNNNHDNSN